MKPPGSMTKAGAVAALLMTGLTAAAQQAPMRLWYDRPAEYFEESLPIGNGKMGALVYGHPDEEEVCLNDITLWTGQPVDRNEGQGAAAWIPEIRRALFAEDYQLADSLQLHVQGHNSAFYQPLGTLHISDLNARTASSGYRRELNIDSALVKVEYRRGEVAYRREYLASHPDQLVAIKLSASQPGALNVRVALTALVPHSVKASHNSQLTMTGHAMGNEQETIHFCAIVKAQSDGQQQASDSTLYIYGASEAVLYVVNETSFNGFDKHPVKQGADYLGNAADRAWHTQNVSYGEVRQRHVADYQRLYDRVKLRLGQPQHTTETSHEGQQEERDARRLTTNELLKAHQEQPSKYLETLYFQFGRYLLIGCSRTPGVPANLQGLWAPHLWSPWRGNYTMNINLEENYWPAFTANLAEMAEPLDDFIKALAANGAHTARTFYGVDHGWCASHNSDIWAMTNPVGEHRESPMWANWNMGGAWLVNTLWDHYLFTQDEEYLCTVAYPLMKGAADFCMDWLIDDPKHPGQLITAPSTSPENEYVTDGGYRGVTCYGGTADLAITRELLLNTHAAFSLLNPNATEGEHRLMLTPLMLLKPYTIGRKGDLNEWYYDWDDKDPQHRHQSHLIGLYPGSHLSTTATPALAEACRQTLIQKGDQTTGWSTGWRMNLWARLHNGEKAYQIYRRLLTFVHPEGYEGPDKRHGGGTYANLFDAHPPFQIDGNFGGTAGVCEMLMQSRMEWPGTAVAKPYARIELLPALPAAWADGEVKGLCARGGFVVDLSWTGGRVSHATICSRTGGTAVVEYNGKQKKVKLRKGQAKRIL